MPLKSTSGIIINSIGAMKGATYMETEDESVILSLYEKTEQEMSSSKEYKEQISKFNILRDQFNKEITSEQQAELNILLQIKTDMESTTARDFFVEGFKVAIKLMTEVFHKEDK